MDVDGITARQLHSQGLTLEPLRVEHAAELAPVLDDTDLHVFIGGQPATPEELHRRYEQLVVGHSPDGAEIWLNWVVRRQDDGQAVGTVQATITEQDGRLIADIAWVIGSSHQRRGYAREAARTMVGWLREQQVEVVIAFVHPEHEASMAVARAVGLAPTDVITERPGEAGTSLAGVNTDGEVRWEARYGSGRGMSRSSDE